VTKYQIVKSEIKYRGHIFTVRQDEVLMPQGNVAIREVLLHGGAVGIVPLTVSNEVVLVRQYRHATQKYLLEIPAGKLAAEEDPELCALRELREETGVEAESLVKLAEFYNSPGYSSERFHLYLAKIKAIGAMQPDGDEELEMERLILPLTEALSLVDKGEICDAKSIIGLLMTARWLSNKQKSSF